MRLEKRLIAFGGIILIGSAVFAGGQALAFGQQWRPAQGFGPSSAGSYQGVANMPSFRPHGAARPVIQRTYGLYRPRSHQSAYPQRAVHMQPQRPRFAAWQGYPQHRRWVPHGNGFYPSPRPMNTGYPGAGWPAPFVATMQPWGQQMPMFTRQFGWRPAAHPWMAPSPMSPRPQYRQPRYAMPAPPQMAGFRPTAPGHVPVAGSWRPAMQPVQAVHPQYVYQRYVVRSPAFAGHQPVFRSMPGAGYQAPRAGMGAPNRAPLVAAGAYWRPDHRIARVQNSAGHPFRPQAYGRAMAPKKELGSREREGLEFTRNKLPGWVTTYQDSGYEGACGWCSGS